MSDTLQVEPVETKDASTWPGVAADGRSDELSEEVSGLLRSR